MSPIMYLMIKLMDEIAANNEARCRLILKANWKEMMSQAATQQQTHCCNLQHLPPFTT